MQHDFAVKQRKPDIQFHYHDTEVLRRASKILSTASVEQLPNCINEILLREQKQAVHRINLIAAESIASPMVRALLADPIGGRMGGGQIGALNRLFPHCEHLDELEALCIECYKKLFHSDFCEYRLNSNMLAIALIYMGFADTGDAIMSFALPHGGDTSNTPMGPPGLLGLNTYSIPFDPLQQCIIWDEFEYQARKIQPRIVAISKTVSLFSLPLKKIKELIQQWSGLLFVDAAHELGLIAGGVMTSPLGQGADMLSGSVGKSFSGPQSGVLLWDDANFTETICRTAFPMLVSSYQLNRVAAMTLAAVEMMHFGQQFMQRTVNNARILGKELRSQGIPVLFEERGFSETHQLLIDAESYGGGRVASQRLAQVGILSNQIISPKDSPDRLFDPSGLRLGTTSVSRLGMGEAEMKTLAAVIADVLQDRGAISRMQNTVNELSGQFHTVYYNFEHGLPD